MSNSPSKTSPRPAPLSIRLTAAERRALETRAGSLPISTYIKCVVFAAAAPRRQQRVSITQEHAARILGLLGQTRLAPTLAQLAKAADTGVLPLGAATEAALHRACDDIGEIRRLLMQALGLRSVDQSDEPLSATFRRRAGP